MPRPRRLGVRERIGADGAVVTPLDEADALAKIRALLADGVESIAVAFLHAYRAGAHEARVRELIAREAPRCWVSLSSEISPELREYERTSTTVVNAALQPVVAGYIASLDSRLAAAGVRAPLRIMQSNGGLVHAASGRCAPRAPRGLGPGRGRGGRHGGRPGRRLPARAHHGHGWHELRSRPRRRRAEAGRAEGGRRQSHPRPELRHPRARRGGRLHRLGRRRRRAARRPAERRRRPGARLLRTRRHRAHRHRRESRPRAAQSRELPRRRA